MYTYVYIDICIYRHFWGPHAHMYINAVICNIQALQKCHVCVHVRVHTRACINIILQFWCSESESEWARILNSELRIWLFTLCDRFWFWVWKLVYEFWIPRVWVYMFTYCDMVRSLSRNTHKFGILVYIHIQVFMRLCMYEYRIFLRFFIIYAHDHMHACIIPWACACMYFWMRAL
jgi:hypothetical protein